MFPSSCPAVTLSRTWSLMLVLCPGIEYADGKLRAVHAAAVWKASHIGLPRDKILEAFQGEMVAAQSAQTSNAKKRTAAEAKLELASAPKKLCESLGACFSIAAAAGGA